MLEIKRDNLDENSLIQNKWVLSNYGPNGESIDYHCFFPIKVLGGQNILKNGNSLSKTISFISPHYEMSIVFDLFLLKNSNEPTHISIKLNETQIYEFELNYYSIALSSSNGNFCNALNKRHKRVFLNFKSNSPFSLKLSIKLEEENNVNSFWGIHNLVLQIKACHPTCKTCSGSLPTNCLSCYLNAILNSDSSCSCAPDFLQNPVDLIIPCKSIPCITCCPYNCKVCGQDECIECFYPLYLLNKKCASTCPSDSFAIEMPFRKCAVCSENCKQCIGSISSYNCDECKSGFFLFESKCLVKCPDFYYSNLLSNKCEKCYMNCKTCRNSNNNQCSSCEDGFYLSNAECKSCHSFCTTCNNDSILGCISCMANAKLNSNGECKCELGYYLKITSTECLTGSCYSCLQCNENCLTCLGPNSNDCSSCKSDQQLLNGECLDSKCDASCSECVGTSVNQCIKCFDNFYLKIIDQTTQIGECYNICPYPLLSNTNNFTCVETCSSYQYVEMNNQLNTMCKNCNKTCSKCFGPFANNCFECSENKYVLNGECFLACPIRYYSDFNSTVCKECSPNCLKCSSADNCYQCNENTILKNFKCFDYIYINPELHMHPEIPYFYLLTFNESWPEFFENITKTDYLEISISNMDTKDYTYTIASSLGSNKVFEIFVKFNIESIQSDNSYLTMTLKELPQTDYKFVNKIFSLSVPRIPLCKTDQTYNFSNASCQNIQKIGAILTKTTEPKVINLEFSDNFYEYFILLNKTSTIQIAGFNETFFNYSIISSQDLKITKNFEIHLSFANYFTDRHYLSLNFNPPIQIKQNLNKRLEKETISIEMMEYYVVDTFIKKNQEITQPLVSSLSVSVGALGSNSLTYKGVTAILLIKYLRYIDVTYPNNLNQLYSNSKNADSFIFPTLQFEGKFNLNTPTNKILFYEISPLVLENCSGKIFELVLLFLVGMVLYPLLKNLFKYGEIRNKIVELIGRKLFMLFSFNIFIMYFMMYFMDVLFFCFINFRWSNHDNYEGKLNLSISILIFVIVLSFLVYLVYVLISIHHYSLENKRDDIIKLDMQSPSNRNLFINNINLMALSKNDKIIRKLNEGSETIQDEVSNLIYALNKEKIIEKTVVNFQKKGDYNPSDSIEDNQIFTETTENKLNMTNEKHDVENDVKNTHQYNNYLENNQESPSNSPKVLQNLPKYYSFLKFEFLWSKFKKRKIIKILTPIVYLIRCLLIAAATVFLNDLPLFLSILITLINLFVISYMFIGFSYKKLAYFIFDVALEILVFVSSLCSFFIASFEHNGVNNNNSTIIFGSIIFYCNTIATYLTLSFLILQIISKIRIVCCPKWIFKKIKPI